MDKKIEKSLKKLELVNQWISNCDTKSSFLLTFYGVIITIIFSSETLTSIITTLSLKKADQINIKSVVLFFSLVLLVFFLFSIIKTVYHIFNTLRARIDSKIFKQQNLNTKSNMFFQTIASRKFKDFETEIDGESDTVYLNDINSQVFINSQIALLKFSNYNKSLLWLIISFGTFLTYVLVK